MGTLAEAQGQTHAARRTHAARAVVALCVAGLCLALASAAGAKTLNPSFTWSGLASTEEWSAAENWEGKAAPVSGEKLAELDFPELNGACAEGLPPDTCYSSEDNISGLNTDSLHIDDGQAYELEGQKPLELGSNGIVAKPTGAKPGPARDVIELPLVLSASQVWSIDGLGGGASGEAGVLLEGPVTGAKAKEELKVELAAGAALVLENDTEVADVTITGANPKRSGSGNGIVELEEGELNSVTGKPVSLGNVLFRGRGEVGRLTTSATELDVGRPVEPAGALEATEARFDPASTVAFRILGDEAKAQTDYPQLLSETGEIDLGEATVAIEVAPPGEGKACPSLTAGETFTFVSTGGTVSGAFANAPRPGHEIPIEFTGGCTHKPQGIQIVYGPHTVTGIVEGEVAEREAQRLAGEHQRAQEAKEAQERQEAKEARERLEAKAIAEAIAARYGQAAGVGKVGVLSFKEGLPDATLAGTSLTVSSGGSLVLKIACPAGQTTCTGTVTLRTLHAVIAAAKQRAAVLTLAAGSFTVAGGQSKAVTLHLSAKARALLARSHVLSARATIVAHNPSGATHTGQSNVTLHAAKAKHS